MTENNEPITDASPQLYTERGRYRDWETDRKSVV